MRNSCCFEIGSGGKKHHEEASAENKVEHGRPPTLDYPDPNVLAREGKGALPILESIFVRFP